MVAKNNIKDLLAKSSSVKELKAGDQLYNYGENASLKTLDNLE